MMHKALTVATVATLLFLVPAPLLAARWGHKKISHHRRASRGGHSFRHLGLHHRQVRHRRLKPHLRLHRPIRHRGIRPRQPHRPRRPRHSLRGLFNAGLGQQRQRQARPKPKPLTQLTIQVDKGNVQISDRTGKMKPFNENDFRLYKPVWNAIKGAMTRSKDPAVRQLASTLETKNEQLPFWFQQQALPRTLVEVLTNSLRAVRSTSNGRGQVSVRAEVVGKNFVLSVKDSGVGLGGVDRQQLFKEGYTTKDNALGNVGLGLYYSNRVVKEMFKGKIEGLDNRADLKAGAGATFRISIPLRQLQRSESRTEPKPQAGYSPPYGGERLVPGLHY